MSGMTRDRAIEILRDDANHASFLEIAEAVEMAIEALKRPHGAWIPCSERLPNTNGIYIITRNIEAHFILDVSYFDGSNTWHADNRINHSRDYLTDVVAWMPLPEPYKGEGEAE